MLAISNKIKADLRSKVTTVQPIILFNAEEGFNGSLTYGPKLALNDSDLQDVKSESFFVSVSQKSITASTRIYDAGSFTQQDHKFTAFPLLKNLPGTKESIDWQKKKFKIGSCNLQLDNGIYKGERISDRLLETGINKIVVLFWTTQSVDHLNDAREIFYGRVKNIKHDDRTCTVELEDAANTTIHKTIPTEYVKKSETTPERSWFKPYPMVYGKVYQSPLIQVNSHNIESWEQPSLTILGEENATSSIDVEYAIDAKPIFDTYSMPSYAYVTRNPYGPLWFYSDPGWYKLPQTSIAAERFNGSLEGMNDFPIDNNQIQYNIDLDNSMVRFSRSKRGSMLPTNLCGGGFFEIEAFRLCQEVIGAQNASPSYSWDAQHQDLDALLSTNPNSFYTVGFNLDPHDPNSDQLPMYLKSSRVYTRSSIVLGLDPLSDQLSSKFAMTWFINKSDVRNYTDDEVNAGGYTYFGAGQNSLQANDETNLMIFEINFPSYEEGNDDVLFEVYNGAGSYQNDTFTTTSDVSQMHFVENWIRAGGTTKFSITLDNIFGPSGLPAGDPGTLTHQNIAGSHNASQLITIYHFYLYNVGYVQRILVDDMFNKDLHCSVLGRIDDSGKFIQNPAEVVKHIVQKEITATSSFDGTSYQDAIDAHGEEDIEIPQFCNTATEGIIVDDTYLSGSGPSCGTVDAADPGPFYLMIPVVYSDVIFDSDIKRLPRYRFDYAGGRQFTKENILNGEWINLENFTSIDFTETVNSAENNFIIKDEVGNRCRFTNSQGWEFLDSDFICESGHTYQMYIFHHSIISEYVEGRIETMQLDTPLEGIVYGQNDDPVDNWKMISTDLNNISYSGSYTAQEGDIWCHPSLFNIPDFLDVLQGIGVPDLNDDGVGLDDIEAFVNNPNYYRQSLELSRTTNIQAKYWHNNAVDSSRISGTFNYVSIEPSIKLSISLAERIDSKEFIEDVLTNTKSALLLRKDVAKFITQKDFYDKSVIQDDDGNFSEFRYISHLDVGKMSYKRTTTKNIITHLNVLYNWDSAAEKFREETGYKNITDPSLLGSNYDHSFYNLRETNFDLTEEYPDSSEEFKAYYIQDLASALLLRDHMLMKYAQQRLQLEFELPVKYLALEPGDIIAFDNLIGNLKAFGLDYTRSEILNGQIIYPLFMIIEIKKKQDKIEIKAEQLQRLTKGLQEDIFTNETVGIEPDIYQPNAAIPFDVTGDGIINVIDIITTVNDILSNGEYNPSFDFNGDGSVNVVDIISLVNYILDPQPGQFYVQGLLDSYFIGDLSLNHKVSKLKSTVNITPSWGEFIPNDQYASELDYSLYYQYFIQNYGYIEPGDLYVGDDTNLTNYLTSVFPDVNNFPNIDDEFVNFINDVPVIYGESIYNAGGSWNLFNHLTPSNVTPFDSDKGRFVFEFVAKDLGGVTETADQYRLISGGLSGPIKDIVFINLLLNMGINAYQTQFINDLKGTIYDKLENNFSDLSGDNGLYRLQDLLNGPDAPSNQFQFMNDLDVINMQLEQITGGIYTDIIGDGLTNDGSMIKGHVKVQIDLQLLQNGLDNFFNRPELIDFLTGNDISQAWSSNSFSNVLNNPFWYFYGAADILSTDIGLAEQAGINLNSTQCLSINEISYNHPVGAMFKFILGTGSGQLSIDSNNYFIVDIEFGGSQVNNIINYVEGENE